MSRRVGLAATIVLAPLTVYALLATAQGAPRFPTRNECVREAVEGQPVDLVFARFDDPLSAVRAREEVVRVGFIGTEEFPDGCGRWKVVLEDVPSVEIAREIQVEAATVDLSPTLELASDG